MDYRTFLEKPLIITDEDFYLIIVLALILLSSHRKHLHRIKTKESFNGRFDLTGWHVDVLDLEKDSTLRNPFIVRDGMLISLKRLEGQFNYRCCFYFELLN
ncbi:MAG: hypothetical protein IPJ20_15180 [Flammeovirgaceae bacterium]|nr:hypothetical protein [Flammeovirgaceae bacterium]